MEQTITRLEYQIKKLEVLFKSTPEKIGEKHNPKYFALRGKLKNLYKRLEDLKRLKYLAM